MKIIAAGDKSRYEYLKYLTGEGFFKNEFLTNDVLVSGEKKSVGEGCLFFETSKLPLHTEFFFPAELSLKDFDWDFADKVVFFDEFPFVTETQANRLESILNESRINSVEAVLFLNDMKGLDSDVTNFDDAIGEAKKFYASKNVNVIEYRIGKRERFSFANASSLANNCSNFFASKIARCKEKLQGNFDFDYELAYLGIEPFVESPEVLDSFCKFSSKSKSQNLFAECQSNASVFFWEKNKNVFVKFASELYKNYVQDVCVWNLDKDIENLFCHIVQSFFAETASNAQVAFDGEREDFVEFQNKNISFFVDFKSGIVEFFRHKMRDFIKNYAAQRLDKLEDLGGFNR